jgi:hypothetical protein
MKKPHPRKTNKRKAARGRSRSGHRRPQPQLDGHGRHVVQSIAAMENLIESFRGLAEPMAAVEDEYQALVAELASEVERFDSMRLIEVGRLALLPISPVGDFKPAPESTPAHIELMALIALAAKGTVADEADTVGLQEMSAFVAQVRSRLDRLLRLSLLRAIDGADQSDSLTMVAFALRNQQIFLRNPSYPEMARVTVLQLMDGKDEVRDGLSSALGFHAEEALTVLEAINKLQEDKMNDRASAFGEVMDTLMGITPSPKGVSAEAKAEGLKAFGDLFEPSVEQAAASIDELVLRTGFSDDLVRAVVDRFRLDLGTKTVMDVVEEFALGNNPLRATPLVAAGDQLMLLHPALTINAVKESFEEYLKSSALWNVYQKHRGDLLERRTRDALDRVVPGAVFRDAFEYYVPANDDEEQAADPSKYTKRVEGDHLAVMDDVALIVEDKAVALSALAKGGKIARIRNDLSGIVSKAADQAVRLKGAIERDGGVRIHGEGWVEFSQIREVHTITVSLDDLSGIATATTELVRAGLLKPDNIPWTVSLHDLDLITQLVDRPAEFLLYLQRRRNPDATAMFMATDELDLFLYFFARGLWVEPDPDKVQEVFDFLPMVTRADRRRYRRQIPTMITSRTDDLDQWFYTKDSPGGPRGPKPAMTLSPFADLIDEIQARGDFGWLSVGATLLAGSTETQKRLVAIADDLLARPRDDGGGRSLTVPLTGSTVQAEGWLLVWATRPIGQDPVECEKSLRDYLRTKKHQLNLPRGAVLLFDEENGRLDGVYYDGYLGDLDPSLVPALGRLKARKVTQADRYRIP